jgi:hypothetical protein
MNISDVSKVQNTFLICTARKRSFRLYTLKNKISLGEKGKKLKVKFCRGGRHVSLGDIGETDTPSPSLSFYNLETKTQAVQSQRNLNPSRHFFYRPENPCRQGTAAEKDLAW